MQAGDPTTRPPQAAPTIPLLRKLRPATRPVDHRSVALFRLGEMCNNACPMCSNSGRTEAFFTEREELLRRVARLADLGMPRVVLTGGEPTIHPAFWDVVAALRARGVAWDINTHGRSFAAPGFAARAADEGLQRAIVSLHSHRPDVAAVISGTGEQGHHETVAGIEALQAAGVWLMLNLVLTRANLDHLGEYLRWCGQRFGPAPPVFKLVFPTTIGRGGGWDGIQLSFTEVRAPLAEAVAAADELGLRVLFESFPNCVLGRPRARNQGRAGFGETHYLDDITGDRLYPIDHIEAALSAYPERCAGCAALKRCPGVPPEYVRRYGADELAPFPAAAARPTTR